MDILKVFKLANDEYEINILGTDEDPLFQANQIGKVLEIKNIHTTVKKFDDADEKVIHTTYTPGGPQQVTFLTELGLYRLLGMSRKPIARVFQKWVGKAVKEIRLTGTYELQRQREIDAEIAQAQEERAIHNTFVSSLNRKRVVYFTKVKEVDEKNILIKLGWTDDIKSRTRQHANDYGMSVLQNVFECNNNREFELFLKRHPTFTCHGYVDTVNGKRSTELFMFSKEEYEEAIGVVKKNITSYFGFNPEQYLENTRLHIEGKRLDLNLKRQENLQSIIEILKNPPKNEALLKVIMDELTNDKMSHTETTDEDIVHDEDITKKSIDDRPRENTKNRRVQKYNAETFELLETYEGLMDVIRKNKTYSKVGVKSAATRNTIYNGYRWFFIERLDEDVKYQIPPTFDISTSIPKLIAMLDLKKEKIVDVFLSQADAARAKKLKHKTAINNAIKKGTISQGNYYKLFKDCNEELQLEYLSRAELPSPVLPKGTQIEQIHPQTLQSVKIHTSINEVLKEFHIARETLLRVCKTNEVYKGFMWKFVENTES